MKDSPKKLNLMSCHLLRGLTNSSKNILYFYSDTKYILFLIDMSAVVEAERAIGFTHSHNDVVNWDTFNDGEERKKK